MAEPHPHVVATLGRFELRRRLRADPPFEQWLARDSANGSTVEITCVTSGPMPPVARLEPGARPCPEILPYLEQGRIGDREVLVVPHRSGCSALMDYCRPDRLLPQEQVAALFAGIAQTLGTLHAVAGAHGMLTPASILVQGAADGTVYASKITANRRLSLGTGGLQPKHYAAPEVQGGTAPSVSSDIYSLGAILFETLAGRLPHARADGARDSADKWPSLRLFRSGIAPLFERVLHKALRGNPAQRYRSVLELAADLSLLADCPPGETLGISSQGIFVAARALECFATLTDSELWEVVNACRWLTFDADTLVADADRDGNVVHIIVSGKVALFEHGRLLAQLNPGGCIGAQHLLQEAESNAKTYASAGTTLLTIPAAAIGHMTTPCQLALHRHLLRQLTRQLRRVTSSAAGE